MYSTSVFVISSSFGRRRHLAALITTTRNNASCRISSHQSWWPSVARMQAAAAAAAIQVTYLFIVHSRWSSVYRLTSVPVCTVFCLCQWWCLIRDSIIRPPVYGSNGRTDKMLDRDVFLFSFFSPRVLGVPSTDRPETLPHGQNLS